MPISKSQHVVSIVLIIIISGIGFARGDSTASGEGKKTFSELREKYGIDGTTDDNGNLISASLNSTSNLDAAINEIQRVETLQILWMSDATVGQKQLQSLSSLPKLWQLKLLHCEVKNNDLAVIKDFPSLIELDLVNSSVDDSALTALDGATKLERLRLDKTKVTDRAVKLLQTLPNLHHLYLKSTVVTDDSMKELGKIETLQVLDLSNTAISDKGLLDLAGLYQLNTLRVTGTKVTPSGRAAFMAANSKSRTDAEERGLIDRKRPRLKTLGQ
jgi:Leucine Rich Repeat (LRR) protein